METARPKVIKSDTRQWPSGRVRIAVMEIPNHPEKNYIILEKNFFGKSINQPQKFLLRTHDWQNLKRLIEGDQKEKGFSKVAGWEKPVIVDSSSIEKIIKENPDLIETVLSVPNITKLSSTSLEALDRLAIRVFEIKKNNIDLILKRLAESSTNTLLNFADLLKDLKLNQVSMLGSLIYQKMRIIDLLEQVCICTDSREKAVHEIFEKNPWLLGMGYEIVQSDKPVANYLESNIKLDSETNKRPDLIIKRVPYREEIIIVELKAPGIKLSANHIGQVLGYKATIQKIKPNIKEIHCYIFGYEKSPSFILSNDVTIQTFAELISKIRDEYKECAKILETGKEEY